MKIISKNIDYMLNYGNAPKVIIEVDALPEFDPMAPIWNYDEGMVWAEIDGIIKYIVYSTPNYENPRYNGFGGAELSYHLKSGRILSGNNWWSGGAYGLTTFVGVDCMEVLLKTNSGTVLAAIRIDLLKELFPNNTFIKRELGDMFSWEIVKPS